MDMLEGKSLTNQMNQTYSASIILKNKKIVVYYFTASWVPTKDLLEKLLVVYQENQKRKTGIEIIFVSADNEERSYSLEFATHGTWLAIPFKNDTSVELRWKYDVTSLPQLIVVRKDDGLIITRKGKEELMELGLNVLVTWTEYVQK